MFPSVYHVSGLCKYQVNNIYVNHVILVFYFHPIDYPDKFKIVSVETKNSVIYEIASSWLPKSSRAFLFWFSGYNR
jgi:hypothetical protein